MTALLSRHHHQRCGRLSCLLVLWGLGAFQRPGGCIQPRLALICLEGVALNCPRHRTPGKECRASNRRTWPHGGLPALVDTRLPQCRQACLPVVASDPGRYTCPGVVAPAPVETGLPHCRHAGGLSQSYTHREAGRLGSSLHRYFLPPCKEN